MSEDALDSANKMAPLRYTPDNMDEAWLIAAEHAFAHLIYGNGVPAQLRCVEHCGGGRWVVFGTQGARVLKAEFTSREIGLVRWTLDRERGHRG
jgi:hypothetical protein